MTTERQRVSRSHERKAAKKLSAKQHSGSGSGSKHLDMHNDKSLIECKTVLEGNRQITLKADDLEKLCFLAAIQDRQAIMHIRLAGKHYLLIPEEEYVENDGQQHGS